MRKCDTVVDSTSVQQRDEKYNDVTRHPSHFRRRPPILVRERARRAPPTLGEDVDVQRNHIMMG